MSTCRPPQGTWWVVFAFGRPVINDLDDLITECWEFQVGAEGAAQLGDPGRFTPSLSKAVMLQRLLGASWPACVT